MAPEVVTLFCKLGSKFLEVVDLAVENDPYLTVVGHHGDAPQQKGQ